MACPACGGAERHALAPNYFECRSQIAVETVRPVPDPAAPPGSGRCVPLRETHYETCGERYQEGAPTVTDGTPVPRCGCGMFAIGACVDCSTPLCGTHGGRFEGAFVCSEHFAERQRRRQQIEWERDAPRRAAEQAKAEREYAARQAELHLYQRDRLRFMDVVLELEDRSEQLVVTVARTAADVQGECSDRGVVSALFPQLWPTPDKVDFAADLPRWNSSAIARWYASRAKGRVPYARYDRKSRYNEMWFEPMLGRPRKGWVFPSAKVIVHPAYTEKSPVQMKCFVEHTGAFFQQGNPANTRRMRSALIGPGGDLNSAALIEMANRARAGRGVPRLETPARLAAPLGFDMPVPTDREAVEAAALAAERASLKH